MPMICSKHTVDFGSWRQGGICREGPGNICIGAIRVRILLSDNILALDSGAPGKTYSSEYTVQPV